MKNYQNYTGSNIGVQIRKLFEPATYPSHALPGVDVQYLPARKQVEEL